MRQAFFLAKAVSITEVVSLLWKFVNSCRFPAHSDWGTLSEKGTIKRSEEECSMMLGFYTSCKIFISQDIWSESGQGRYHPIKSRMRSITRRKRKCSAASLLLPGFSFNAWERCGQDSVFSSVFSIIAWRIILLMTSILFWIISFQMHHWSLFEPLIVEWEGQCLFLSFKIQTYNAYWYREWNPSRATKACPIRRRVPFAQTPSRDTSVGCHKILRIELESRGFLGHLRREPQSLPTIQKFLFKAV